MRRNPPRQARAPAADDWPVLGWHGPRSFGRAGAPREPVDRRAHTRSSPPRMVLVSSSPSARRTAEGPRLGSAATGAAARLHGALAPYVQAAHARRENP